jgi:hypothetical protein
MRARSQEVTLSATTDAPRSSPLRYASLGRSDDEMPDDDNFGLRLPVHPTAPSTESLMPTDKDTAEIIQLLKNAEVRSAKAVTNADFTNLANTVMEGIRDVETKLTARIETVEGVVQVHALALRAMADRTGGTSNMVNVRSNSSVPRRMSPMPQTINVEQTSGGGIKITDGTQWEKVLKRLDDQEKAITVMEEREASAQEAAYLAQVRQGAVQEYATKLEEKSKKNARLYKRLTMAGAVPVLVAIVHLIQAYILGHQ